MDRRAGSIEAAIGAGVGRARRRSGDTIEDVEREIVDGPNLPRSRWKEIAIVLDSGSKSDQDQAARFREALAFTGAAQVEEYLGVFLTDERTPRKTVMTKKFCDEQSDDRELFEQEIRPYRPSDRTTTSSNDPRPHAGAAEIATAAAANYRREKRERGLLDYDDLIDNTLEMLDRVSPGWVHYKLDRGVDHVLIDEAQDTSPKQWDIVAHIISDFTSGEGARDGVVRTIFAVGRREAVDLFLSRRSTSRVRRAAPIAATEIRRCRIEIRSGLLHLLVPLGTGDPASQSIMCFANQMIYRSIHSTETGYPIHNSLADAGPSLIDLWDLQQPEVKQDIEGWRAPFDGLSQTSPEVKLARRIQGEIKRLVDSGTMTGSAGKRRPLRYGDMLVLVRRRGNVFDAVIQALEARQHSRRRRRPAEIDRTYRDHRSDEPRRCAVVAAGRSGAGGGAEKSAVWTYRRRSVQAGLATQGIAAAVR